jgi:hypothetical protein
MQNGTKRTSKSCRREILTFEHTDGLNYVNLGVEKYKNLYAKENLEILWAYGGGLGLMFPKSNVKLFGNERSDDFTLQVSEQM